MTNGREIGVILSLYRLARPKNPNYEAKFKGVFSTLTLVAAVKELLNNIEGALSKVHCPVPIVRHLPTDTSPVGLLPIATFAGRDICRSRHLPVATFAGRDICRSRHLPVATFAGRDICRSRHLPVATFAGRDICRSRHLPVVDICRSRHLPVNRPTFLQTYNFAAKYIFLPLTGFSIEQDHASLSG